MLLSIIIPMYKVEPYIERCLISCINQDISADEYEIICVNDGSPDSSASIARRIAEAHSNIKVVDRSNGGLSEARNTGLRIAKGDYVWFVDSDDWIKENCLKKITTICLQRKLDMLQICAADNIEGRNIRRFSYSDEISVFSGKTVLEKNIPYCAPFAVYRRLFLIQNNLYFYKGILHEDNEFKPRAYYYANRISSINDIMYYVYQNPNSITRTINPQKAFDGIIIMNRLHKFAKDNSDAESLFHKIITATFNASLHDIVQTSELDMKKFSEEMCKNKKLYRHLVFSGRLIYLLEGLLLMIFPSKSVSIYKMLNSLDKRKIKTKK